MKKYFSGLLTGVIISITVSAYANGHIRLVVNGEDMSDKMDTSPKMIDGRVFVPVRFVAENMGAYVEWDEASNTVTITEKSEGTFIGSKESNIYHKHTCAWVKNILESTRVGFESVEDAELAGYVPFATCLVD